MRIAESQIKHIDDKRKLNRQAYMAGRWFRMAASCCCSSVREWRNCRPYCPVPDHRTTAPSILTDKDSSGISMLMRTSVPGERTVELRTRQPFRDRSTTKPSCFPAANINLARNEVGAR